MNLVIGYQILIKIDYQFDIEYGFQGRSQPVNGVYAKKPHKKPG